MKPRLSLVLLLGILTATVQAAPSPEDALLKVEGAIVPTAGQAASLWDSAMLDALPEHEIKTHTPWYDEAKTFRGPLLKDGVEKSRRQWPATHHYRS